MIKSKYILYFVFGICIFVSLRYAGIPFFWDGTFFSEVACRFYDGTYTPWDCPINLDNVTFPVYSTYLALAWKLFAKSLFVSHLVLLPFLLGIVFEFYKLAKHFLSDKFVSLSLLLLVMQPTLGTQSILMGYDVPLLYFFLCSVNLLLNSRLVLYSFILPFVGLYSIRGLFLYIALFIIVIAFKYKKEKWESLFTAFKLHAFSALLIILWFVYHKIKTGWFIISPIHESTDEQVHSAGMMLRQTAYIGWKLLDFGEVCLWLFLVIYGGIFLRKNTNEQFKIQLQLLLIPIALSAALMIPFSNPIGHRYFMFGNTILIIAVSFLLEQFKKQWLSFCLFLFFCTSLLSGNFWIYPEKYGNGWDASLKILPYFELKNKMDHYIKEQSIPANDIGTQYPLIADTRYSYLTTDSYFYNNVWSGPIGKYTYFLHTNVINTDIPEQITIVKKEWKLLQRYESGLVYLELYKK